MAASVNLCYIYVLAFTVSASSAAFPIQPFKWFQDVFSSTINLTWWNMGEREVGENDVHVPLSPPSVKCRGYECPKFRTVEEFDGYEKRCYDFIDWVHTGVACNHNDTLDFMGMYGILSKYINGDNKQKVKLNMTFPIMVRTYELKKTKHGQDIKLLLHFFVPPGNVSRMPKPLDKRISFPHMGNICFFVRSFGGHVMSYGVDLKKEKALLQTALERDQQSYHTYMYFFMSYDLPDVKNDRYNEVLFKAYM